MIKKLATAHQNHISPRLSSLKSLDFGDLPCAATPSLLRQERKGDPRNLTISRMTLTGGSSCGQWLEKLGLKPFILSSFMASTHPVVPSENVFFPVAPKAEASLLNVNIPVKPWVSGAIRQTSAKRY